MELLRHGIHVFADVAIRSDQASQQIHLETLPPPSAEDLLEALLGTDASLADLRRVLIERTQGHPLFLEESVRTLVELRVLVGEPGGYRLRGSAHGVTLPPTVQAILAARIDWLDPDDKRVLQAASVIGRDVPFRLLLAIAAMPENRLREAVGRLQTAELLYETRLFPELEHTFKHALTHEVAYGMLLQDRRRALHAATLEAIEQLAGERVNAYVDQLSHHAFKAEQWVAAVKYARLAATKWTSASVYQSAARHLEQGLHAVGQLPDGQERLEQTFQLHVEMQNALNCLGQVEPVLEHLHEAQKLAEQLGDPRRLGQVLAHLTYGLHLAARTPAGVAAGEQAVAIAASLADRELLVLAALRLGQIYWLAGRFADALQACRRVIDALPPGPALERFGMPALPSVNARFFASQALAQLGRFAEAEQLGAEAVQFAEEIGHPYTLILACAAAGAPHLVRGDGRAAIPWQERSLAIARELAVGIQVPFQSTLLGWAYSLAGRSREAVALLEEMLEMESSLRFFAVRPRTLTYLGYARLDLGELDRARDAAQRAVEFCARTDRKGDEANAFALLGEIHLRETPARLDAAESALTTSLAIAEQLGMKPCIARLHHSWARLETDLGNATAAARHHVIAIDLSRTLNLAPRSPEPRSSA